MLGQICASSSLYVAMTLRSANQYSPRRSNMSEHVFGRRRPSHIDDFRLHIEHDAQRRDTQYRDLPAATGQPPYHLELNTVLPAPHIQAITNARKLVFHVNGDMGGINDSTPQTLV